MINDQDAYVYVIANLGDAGQPCFPTKVGVTKKPNQRFGVLQTASPRKLIRVAVYTVPNIGCARDVEQAFHDVKREHRLYGEWFSIDPIDAAISLALCIRAHFQVVIEADGTVGEHAGQLLEYLCRRAGLMLFPDLCRETI